MFVFLVLVNGDMQQKNQWNFLSGFKEKNQPICDIEVQHNINKQPKCLYGYGKGPLTQIVMLLLRKRLEERMEELFELRFSTYHYLRMKEFASKEWPRNVQSVLPGKIIMVEWVETFQSKEISKLNILLLPVFFFICCFCLKKLFVQDVRGLVVNPLVEYNEIPPAA